MRDTVENDKYIVEGEETIVLNKEDFLISYVAKSNIPVLNDDNAVLENVNDAVFSQKMMGDGFAIVPSSNKIVSPINGSVEVAFPTGHAFGLKALIMLKCSYCPKLFTNSLQFLSKHLWCFSEQ